MSKPGLAAESEHWDLVLKPQTSLFRLNFRDVWAYRDLLWLLVRRDFVSFYKQTVLGPIWFFIQPLFTTFIYTFIFGGLAKISTGSVPGPLFYMAGITCWNYFSDCITKTSTVFKDNANIFGKVYFPRLIMPLSLVLSNLVRFAVQMILFLMAMAWFYWGRGMHGFHITSYIVLFPLIVALMALQGLGLGMIVTALTTRYRDLALLVVFGVQLMMYGTTVVYPLTTVIQKYPQISWLVTYNPMTEVIEIFRLGFLGEGTFSWGLLGYAVAVTLVMLFAGIFTFNKIERSFVDTV